MTMRREAFVAVLEGGYLTGYTLDLLAKSYTMQVDVLDSGRLSRYEVSFLGVSAFEFHDESVNRWERIELTEVRIDEPPEGSSTEEWTVWLNHWDVAQILIKCAGIRIDGEALA